MDGVKKEIKEMVLQPLRYPEVYKQSRLAKPPQVAVRAMRLCLCLCLSVRLSVYHCTYVRVWVFHVRTGCTSDGPARNRQDYAGEGNHKGLECL